MLAAHVEGENVAQQVGAMSWKKCSFSSDIRESENKQLFLSHSLQPHHCRELFLAWKTLSTFTTCERFLPILVTIPQTTRLYRVLLSLTLSLYCSLSYFLIQYNGKFTSFIADRSLPPSQLTLSSLFHIHFVEISCYGNWNKYLMNRVNSNILVTQSFVEHHKM